VLNDITADSKRGVAEDGSQANQRGFTKFEDGGGDGAMFDAAGRFYVTSGAGIQVIGPDGKNLGVIPVPRGVSSATISGPDRKTLYHHDSVDRAGAERARQVSWLRGSAPKIVARSFMRPVTPDP
jgi:sugar lactone lactonase YvrE